MHRNSALATIHIAAKQLGFDEDTYRDLLEGITGKRSAKDMDPREHNQIIREFKRLGFRVESQKQKPRRYDELGHRPGMASPATLRMIEVLWHQVCRAKDERTSLQRWLFKWYGVSDIRFLDFENGEKAKEALKSMGKRGG